MRLLQRAYVAAVVAVFLSIPALGQKVETDYDHSVNFSRYHTYSWGHIHSSDPFFEDRIRAAVDHELQAKGWTVVPAGGGDVMLTAVLIEKSQTEYSTFYTGLGGGWRWHGWGGIATTEVDKIPVGTLVVDIYDCASEELLWRGMAQDQLSDKADKNSKKIEKSVEKMFAKFPPKAL